MNSFNEGVCLNPENDSKIKTYNRWPLTHKKQVFGDRLSVLVHLTKNNIEDFPEQNLFLLSKYYFVRAALESKFNRDFSLAEVRKIINDTSWQWRDSFQTQECIKERYQTHPKSVVKE